MSLGLDRARSLWLALVIALSGACSDARQPPQPASFDRPTDVDFVCVRDRGDNLRDVTELKNCRFAASDRALHALVTQSARGEIAAVNLSTERILDNRRDVPGYTFVRTGELPVAIVVSKDHPQLTYVASYGSRDVRVMRTRALVGLTNEDADVQTVSLTIDSVDGGTFGGTPSDMVVLPGERVLLVTLSDVGKVARVPLDAEGLIDEEEGITFIDLPVVSPPAPTAVPVDEPYAKMCGGYQRAPMVPVKERPAPPAATASRPVALAIDRACRDNGGCGQGRVLIADEALPVLHVLDIEALRAGSDPVLEPIATGVPTRDVVTTPSVPEAFTASGEPPSTYFVYAIDAIDGSVMVLENDQLLAINRDPAGQADRLPIENRSGSPTPLALALEVITPEFSLDPKNGYQQYVTDYASQADVVSSRDVCIDDFHTEITPRRLRGVFLSVAMADGTVRIIDVHDTELRRCRDCDLDPADVEDDGVDPQAEPKAPILVRHHPRLSTDPIAINEADRDELQPATNAGVNVRTGGFSVRNNGTVASPLAPRLGCFTCAEGFEQALPDPEDQAAALEEALDSDGGVDGLDNICEEALVCGPNDPWAAPPAVYQISYESQLPNSGAGDGVFVGPRDDGNVTGLLELHSAVSFCERGTLGRDDIGGARDEAACVPAAAALAGDEVVITSELLADERLVSLGRSVTQREACAQVRDKLEEDQTAVLGFEIIAAFEDRVAIRTRLNPPFDSGAIALAWSADPNGDDQEVSLQTCLGDGTVRFYVRSQSDFLVFTQREGFLHNVIANANGRCVVDALSGAARSRRTWTGCAYKDDRIQFQLEPFNADDVVQEPGDGYGAVLQFGINTTAGQLVMNASQIGFGATTLVPARLRYSATDEQLYLVDTYQGGLIPIDLDPFSDTPITSFY